MAHTSLLIDYGNGASKHFVNLAWSEGMNVMDVVDAAQAVTPGFETATSSNFRVGTHLGGVDGLRNDDSASWVIWNGRQELAAGSRRRPRRTSTSWEQATRSRCGTPLMTRRPPRSGPRHGADPGWPRPRGRTGVGPRSPSPPTVLPIPWVAQIDDPDRWSPTAYDTDRATRMISEDLCQVCGGPRGETVYVVVGRPDPDQDPTPVRQSGGALCSVRCARLTAAVCPHYRERWPVRIYAVPHPGERTTTLGGSQVLDDLIDIAAGTAVHHATMGGP